MNINAITCLCDENRILDQQEKAAHATCKSSEATASSCDPLMSHVQFQKGKKKKKKLLDSLSLDSPPLFLFFIFSSSFTAGSKRQSQNLLDTFIQKTLKRQTRADHEHGRKERKGGKKDEAVSETQIQKHCVDLLM